MLTDIACHIMQRIIWSEWDTTVTNDIYCFLFILKYFKNNKSTYMISRDGISASSSAVDTLSTKLWWTYLMREAEKRDAHRERYEELTMVTLELFVLIKMSASAHRCVRLVSPWNDSTEREEI